MTVKELIARLQGIGDKTQEVVLPDGGEIYAVDECVSYDGTERFVGLRDC